MDHQSTERIVSKWDEVVGGYVVVEASVKGLKEVRGATEEELQHRLEDALPGKKLLVEYPDHGITLG